MNDAAATSTSRKTPWHFWAVGILGLLWNGFGGYDYTMSMTQGDAYLQAAGMNQAQMAYYHAMPAWTVAAWAIGVWGALLGTILLLLRSKWAVHAFAASILGLVASLIYTHFLSEGGKLMGQQGLIMNGVIFAGCAFFLWYARRAAQKGLLR